MCLTIPGKVIQIRNDQALLQLNKEKRIVNIGSLKNIEIGDWLLATTDLAVKKISKKEVREILELLGIHNHIDSNKISKRLKEILEAVSKRDLTKKEIIYLLNLRKAKDIEALFSEADIIRKTYLKDLICLHGIIEFSNYCQNNCKYCGLRRDNKKIKRYRMDVNEIVKLAVKAVNRIGYKMLVLQSGMDDFYTDAMLAEIVKRIKEKCRVFLFISIGDRSLSCYKKLKKAGANGVLFRFETSNAKLYLRFHPKGTKKGDFKNRFKLINYLKDLDYYISSGPLIGLPGQTPEDLASDILTMKKLKIDMPSFGPFVPCPNTPLAKESPGSVEWSLKMIAITRLVMKKSRIPVTSALETLDSEARKKGLRCGANSLMFDLTPAKYRKDYQIYPKKAGLPDKVFENYALSPMPESWKMLEREFKIEI